MSRKPAAGSLEAAALALAQEVSGNPDDWERRRKALFSMQQAVEDAGKALPESGGGEKALFTPEVWRHLKEPLKHTLNDLRSAIVKEACILLEKLSSVSGNYMAALMRDMLNVLLQLMANGNSVIVGQVDSCMRHIIAHSRFPRQLKEVEYTVRNSRSKDLRESVGSYVLLMLRTWPAASMDKEAGYLESIVQLLLKDASSAARTDARASFGILMEHWPKRANKVLQAAEPRTAKSLREQYGIGEAGITAAASSSSLSSLAATTTAGSSGGGRGGGAPRASKAAPGAGGTANAKGSRRGPSSAEALRAAESAGNGQQSNPPLSPLRQRRAKPATAPTATAASRGGAKRGSSIPSSSSAPSAAAGVHGSSSSPSPASASTSASSLAARRRRNGLVPGSAGGATSSSPAAAAAAADAKSPLMAAAKAATVRKRRPVTATPTSTSAAGVGTAASTARSPAPKMPSSGTTTTTTTKSAAKAKRLSTSSVASASDAAAAASAAGIRPLVINTASTTPTGSSSSRAAAGPSRPGTLASSPLLVSPDGFLAAPATGLGSAGKRRASGGGGSQGGASSAAGSSVGFGDGAAVTSLVEGDKVRFQVDTQRTGVVRYVGETQFATGVWIGVELPPTADPPGLNDGSVNGVSYFKCPPACGVFAKPDMFDLIREEEEEEEEEDAAARADDGQAAGETEEASANAKASLAGAELLRFHKMFANEALEALNDEMALLPGLESLVDANQPVPADRVRFYVEVLESAAEAREAAAARLRAQIRQTTDRYPSVFSASSPSSASSAATPVAGLGVPGGGDKEAAVEGGGGEPRGIDEEEEEEEDGASGEADGHEKGGDGDEDEGDEDSGEGGEGGGGEGGCGDNDDAEGAAIADNTTTKHEAAAASESKEEGQGQQDEEEGLKDAESGGTADDVDLANKTPKGSGRGGGGGGGSSSGGKNVFGMAGRFLRDVLHIPPGEDEAAAPAAAAGEGKAADAISLPTAAGVDVTLPTTPNAIAADSKSDGEGKEESGAEEETAVGASAEGVVVET